MIRLIYIAIFCAIFISISDFSMAQTNEDDYFYMPEEAKLINNAKFNEALKVFDSAYLSALKDNNFRNMAKYLKNQGDVYLRSSNFQKAVEKYLEALNLSGKYDDKKLERAINNNIGVAYIEMLDYSEAEKYYNKALEISTAIKYNKGIITGHNNLGNLFFIKGDNHKSLENLEKALEAAKNSGNKQEEISVLINLSNVYGSTGKLDKARKNYLYLLDLTKNSEDKTAYADTLHNLAVLETTTGNYKEAVKYFKEALPLYTANNNKKELVQLYINLAVSQNKLANTQSVKEKIIAYQQSRAYFILAEKLAAEINAPDTALYAGRQAQSLSHAELNTCYEIQLQKKASNDKFLEFTGLITSGDNKDLTNIIEHLKENEKMCSAMDIQKAIMEDISSINGLIDKAKMYSFKALLADLYIDLADNYKKLKDYEKANNYLLETIKLKQELSAPDLWLAYYNLAKNYEQTAKIQDAGTNYQLAIDSMLDIANSIPAEDKAGYIDSKQNLFRSYANFKAHNGDIAGAMDIIELSRLSEQSDYILKNYLQIQKGDKPKSEAIKSAVNTKLEAASIQSELYKEKQKAPEQQNVLKIEDLKGQLQQKRQEFHKLAIQLQQDHPEILSYVAIKPTSIRTIQNNLPADSVLVQPIILDDKVLIFLGPAGDKPPLYKEVAINKNEIVANIVKFRRALYNNEDKTSIPEALTYLYNVLIRPIESELSGFKTIIISPYENLRYVPIQALYDGKNYLVEKYGVVNLTSSSIIKASGQESLGELKILAFGNATEDLPAAEQEVKDISKLASGTKLYVRSQASRSAFDTEISGDYNIVHLATHGILNNDTPENSRLLFSGKENNTLTVNDIMGYDFSGKNLIVLSACDSNLGKAKGAEISSLGAAFEMAEAPTVIATLWQVNDKSTSLMMVDFYKNLAAGDTKIEALRKAQVKLLSDKNYQHPYFWSPFVMMGEWK